MILTTRLPPQNRFNEKSLAYDVKSRDTLIFRTVLLKDQISKQIVFKKNSLMPLFRMINTLVTHVSKPNYTVRKTRDFFLT